MKALFPNLIHHDGLRDCVAIMIAAAILRLWIFNGLHGHDDWVYIYVLRSFLNGNYEEVINSLWGLRWGVWTPSLMLFYFLGPNYCLLFLPGFLAGIVALPILYWGTKQATGNAAVARCAAALMAINPVDWFVSTTFRGDIEMSLLGALLVAGICYFESGVGIKRWQPYGLLILGMVWGLGALTKEWALVYGWGFAALVASKLLINKSMPWHYLLVLGGFALVLLVDVLILGMWTGNFAHRLQTSFGWYESARASGDYIKDKTLHLAYLPSVLLGLRNEFTMQGRFTNGYPLVGGYFWVVLPALFWALFWRQRRLVIYLIAVFALGTMAWVQFGSMSMHHYVPYHKEPRYLTIFSAPLALVGAVFLHGIWQRSRQWGRSAILVLSLALFAHTARLLHSEHLLYKQGREVVPVILSWYRERPTGNLWLSSSLQQEVDLHFKFAFHSPVHRHRGKLGFGNLQDSSFIERAKVGDYLIVSQEEIAQRGWDLSTHWSPLSSSLRLPFGWGLYQKAN